MFRKRALWAAVGLAYEGSVAGVAGVVGNADSGRLGATGPFTEARADSGAEVGRGGRGIELLAVTAAAEAWAGVCRPFMDAELLVAGFGVSRAAMGVVVDGDARVAGFAAGRSRGVGCGAAGVYGEAAGRGMWLRFECGVTVAAVAVTEGVTATGGLMRKFGSGWAWSTLAAGVRLCSAGVLFAGAELTASWGSGGGAAAGGGAGVEVDGGEASSAAGGAV